MCHLECGLTGKPVVSKVQVEPSRGSRVCGPPAAAPMTSLRCPGDSRAGAPALAVPISSVGSQHLLDFWHKCGECAGPWPIGQLF